MGSSSCADRVRLPASVLRVAAGCALVLALTACGRSSGKTAAGSPYTLMQMNLCLSGVADCYGKVKYPAGVGDVVAGIRRARPDAVTLNETCSRDVSLIAHQTGYHLRFSKVIYHGKPLPCVHPRGRGVFGDSVLTEAAIERSETKAFRTQAGPERRVWLCVSTRRGVDVCTAHLASNKTDELAANAPQCAELTAILARRAVSRTVIFGGDVNRRSSCAPRGFWTRTDRSADQDPGNQHAYGTAALRSPAVRVLPTEHTDHDVLLVHARLGAQR